tara:strand:+ start:163 stop:783 length:621 start_codon:yes stop_codon:yes gene_type:complete
LAENDWFSVVKVSTAWDNNVSDERLNYFIWNAFQTDTEKLDSFYRNNYYTHHELYYKLRRYITENKPEDVDSFEYKRFDKLVFYELSLLQKMVSETKNYLYYLRNSERIMHFYNNEKKEQLIDRGVDSLATLSKKEFINLYKTLKESTHPKVKQVFASVTSEKEVLKNRIIFYSKMLSKRSPSNTTLDDPQKQRYFHFKNTIREYE